MTAVTVTAMFLFFSCEENKRFEIGYNDSTPPSPPAYIRYEPLYGGATIWFEAPEDEDLLSIDATYVNHEGKEMWFSASFYTDSIQVLGFSDTLPKTVNLFAVDRAGNKSSSLEIEIIPKESAVSMLAGSLYIMSGFSSFFVNWENVLEQDMNVFVDYTCGEGGSGKKGNVIYTSNLENEQRLIRDLDLTPEQPVSVSVRVEDIYGNSMSRDLGSFVLLQDVKIPKDKWILPNTNDSIGGVPQAFLNAAEGRAYMLIDDITNDLTENNFAHTHWIGRTGNPADGNTPWNLMIDLGDYYELSRVITYQRHALADPEVNPRGSYYAGGENVGIYRMYIWDDDTQKWDSVRTHKITFPENLTGRQYMLLACAGDMAYLYPENPGFTKRTRWFRYEALNGFADDYQGTEAATLTEITLYGRKAE
jgi:hypothetical protein